MKTLHSAPIELLPTLTGNKYYALFINSGGVFFEHGATENFNFPGGDIQIGIGQFIPDNVVFGMNDDELNVGSSYTETLQNHQDLQEHGGDKAVWLWDDTGDATTGDGQMTIMFCYAILDFSV
jgi:hypothetical protein